ncbi:MAG TPA: hypothetical protein VNG31_08880, partial [Candidatus Baltobacteraceae bacterium]|nr:hypothetical protein [Candidatus Baltobacteraceae bacterium]
DTQTFATCRLVTQGNFESSPVPWTITFASIGGAQYISSENADRPVRVGPHVYERARIDFEDVATTQPSRYLWNPVAPSKQLLVEPSAR